MKLKGCHNLSSERFGVDWASGIDGVHDSEVDRTRILRRTAMKATHKIRIARFASVELQIALSVV